MEMVRTLFWAGLLDTHEDLKLDQVGPIFAKVSALDAISLVTRAFLGAFVDPDAPRAPPSTSLPQEPSQVVAGTGSDS